jgi:deazaflavin-dependent oxidoreductase (nitroreductase family)
MGDYFFWGPPIPPERRLSEDGLMILPPELGAESFCYLTTTGRTTGQEHTIEIWFALRDDTVFMLSGGRDRADWVRNLKAEPSVRVRIRDHNFVGTGRVVEDPEEDSWARRALVEKYQGGYGGDLTNWGRNSLPVAVDLDG